MVPLLNIVDVKASKEGNVSEKRESVWVSVHTYLYIASVFACYKHLLLDYNKVSSDNLTTT